MTRMTGPDCVVMCNLINTHTHNRFNSRQAVRSNPFMGKKLQVEVIKLYEYTVIIIVHRPFIG